MGVQISWNGMKWGYDAKCIRSVEDLTADRGISVERNEDKEGQPATQTVALDLATVSFSYTVSKAAGGKPRQEYGSIFKALGVHAPLYLNGKRFAVKEMMLKSVSSSDWVLSAKGEPLSVKIAVTFEEYATDKSGLKKDKITRASALRPGVKKAAKTTSALRVGASSSAKAKKAPKNKQMKKWSKK